MRSCSLREGRERLGGPAADPTLPVRLSRPHDFSLSLSILATIAFSFLSLLRLRASRTPPSTTPSIAENHINWKAGTAKKRKWRRPFFSFANIGTPWKWEMCFPSHKKERGVLGQLKRDKKSRRRAPGTRSGDGARAS